MIAAGGTAPINRSRVMPPALPAANDKTKTPNRSSRRLTPAAAPLSAKTKVPTRSSTSRRVSIVGSLTPNRATRRSPALDQPPLGALGRAASRGRNNHALNPGLQGRMDNRGNARAVIGRDLVEPACLLADNAVRS